MTNHQDATRIRRDNAAMRDRLALTCDPETGAVMDEIDRLIFQKEMLEIVQLMIFITTLSVLLFIIALILSEDFRGFASRQAGRLNRISAKVSFKTCT